MVGSILLLLLLQPQNTANSMQYKKTAENHVIVFGSLLLAGGTGAGAGATHT